MTRHHLIGFIGGAFIFVVATIVMFTWNAPPTGRWGAMLVPTIGLLTLAGMSFFLRRLLIPTLLCTGFLFTIASGSWWRVLEGDASTGNGATRNALAALLLDVGGIVLILVGVTLFAREIVKGRLLR